MPSVASPAEIIRAKALLAKGLGQAETPVFTASDVLACLAVLDEALEEINTLGSPHAATDFERGYARAIDSALSSLKSLGADYRDYRAAADKRFNRAISGEHTPPLCEHLFETAPPLSIAAE